MSNEEREILYNKLKRILVLIEEMDNNMALMELEHFIEWVKEVETND